MRNRIYHALLTCNCEQDRPGSHWWGQGQRCERSDAATQGEDIKIVAAGVVDLFMTARETRDKLQQHANERTIRRHLHNSASVVARKTGLDAAHKQQQLLFAAGRVPRTGGTLCSAMSAALAPGGISKWESGTLIPLQLQRALCLACQAQGPHSCYCQGSLPLPGARATLQAWGGKAECRWLSCCHRERSSALCTRWPVLPWTILVSAGWCIHRHCSGLWGASWNKKLQGRHWRWAVGCHQRRVAESADCMHAHTRWPDVAC